ncbi:MAG: hypothetical protein VW739_01465 [Pelagibacteraceae bacterium]
MALMPTQHQEWIKRRNKMEQSQLEKDIEKYFSDLEKIQKRNSKPDSVSEHTFHIKDLVGPDKYKEIEEALKKDK